MGKQPVEFDLYEWMVLTDLIKATPDHKGSDVYGLLKLTKGCSSQVMLDGTTEDARRRSLVDKLDKWWKDGYRYIEFKPFEDQEDSID